MTEAADIDASRPLIAHVITGLDVGGAERMLLRVATRSRAFRHVVIVLACRGRLAGEFEARGVEVRALDAAGLRHAPWAAVRLRSELKRLRPALIQSWLIHANLVTAVVTPMGTPLVWNVRHSLQGFETERLATRTAVRVSALASRRAERIIYNSAVAAIEHEKIGYPSDRRVIVPNGFDLAAHRVSAEVRQAKRAELGVSDDDVLVGLVARAHPIKNHHGFLSAVAILKGEFPQARFLLVGHGTGPSESLAQVWKQELGNRVLWLGERHDIADVTGAFDMACNVSHGEAFSNSLGEAMAAGVPCLATDVGDSASIIGECGWLAAGSQPEEISAALSLALRASPSERSARGSASQRRIADLFGIDAIVERYEEVYRAISLPHRPHLAQR